MHDALCEESAGHIDGHTTQNAIAQIINLYQNLFAHYRSLGVKQAKSLFTADNPRLYTYASGEAELFPRDGILDETASIVAEGQLHKTIPETVDADTLSADICTIAKGCIFEWCLSDGSVDMEIPFQRMAKNYLETAFV